MIPLRETKHPGLLYPLYSHYFFGLYFLIHAKPELYFTALETEPYTPNGDIPVVFIQIAWFEFIFNNLFLYKIFYKREHGYLPDGLE